MNKTVALLLVACSLAHAQAPAPASIGHPFRGPQSSLYGPRVPVQLDVDAAIYSPTITFTIEGKPYQFFGRLLPVEGDGSRIWMGTSADKHNTMVLAKNQDGTFGGTFLVEARAFLISGRGRDAILVESFVSSVMPMHAPSAAATSAPREK